MNNDSHHPFLTRGVRLFAITCAATALVALGGCKERQNANPNEGPQTSSQQGSTGTNNSAGSTGSATTTDGSAAGTGQSPGSSGSSSSSDANGGSTTNR